MTTRHYNWAEDSTPASSQPDAPNAPADAAQADAAHLLELAEEIRQACIVAARDSYEDAAANGLCAEGAWECAVDAMRHLDLVVKLQELGIQNSRR